MAYDPTLAERVLARMGDGVSLNAICSEPGMPPRRDFYRWLEESDELARKYARARERQCQAMADDVMAVGDDLTIPPDHKRVMVDARKWLLSKVMPRVYGDRVSLASDADSPLVVQIVRLGENDGQTER